MARNGHHTHIERELQDWPGVGFTFGMKRRHSTVTVTFQEHSKEIIFAATASDNRAVKNCLSFIRRSLKEMGATKH